ncbi:MAG: hypothetical protein ACLFUG_12140, partial [Nitriliruptoraceae bacterium]
MPARPLRGPVAPDLVARTVGTDIAHTAGTVVASPAGTDVARTAGTVVASPVGTDVARTVGTDVARTVGTVVASPVGTDVARTAGTVVASPVGTVVPPPASTVVGTLVFSGDGLGAGVQAGIGHDRSWIEVADHGGGRQRVAALATWDDRSVLTAPDTGPPRRRNGPHGAHGAA